MFTYIDKWIFAYIILSASVILYVIYLFYILRIPNRDYRKDKWVKVPVSKPNNLSSVSRIHMVE